MTEETQDRFTVYLDGQDGHRGNVLLRSFLLKVHRLERVLGKLERAYLGAGKRRTDFEIIDAEKVNPTSLTLKAVPHVLNYNPAPAFQWSMKQIRAVGDGQEPDSRVTMDIADDLMKLAERDSSDGYKSFWINGFAERVTFDEVFLANAVRLLAERKRQETPPELSWHDGASLGSIVGELKKLDDFENDKEFVIVPPAGRPVICRFPDSMMREMGQYWSKIVRVTGILHYKPDSPFPAYVDVSEGGVEPYKQQPKRTLDQLRGVFEGRERPNPDWDDLQNG